MRRVRLLFSFVGVAGLVLASCGDDDADVGAGGGQRPTVVVTTNILGDVVEAVAGDQVDVVTIMPVGADAHDFQPSAQEAAQMRDADVLIANGGTFEEGLADVVEAAEGDGVPTFEALSAVETIESGEGGHDHSDEEHSDEEHSDEEHSDEEHDHEGEDPHFFTDPVRMAQAVDAMADFLIDNVEGIDAEALRTSADDYIAELEDLDVEVAELLSGIPENDRVLVTNHDVFGYFADRYDFEIAGTVIPSGSTADGASAAELTELAELVEEEGVAAIFGDTSSSDELAETLAAEVGGDVAVVELFTESLGEGASGGATYLEMVRTNAERIAEALGA